jgi:hypothetical protein
MTRMRCPACAARAPGRATALLVEDDPGPGGRRAGRVWWICAGCSDLVGTRIGRRRRARLTRAGAGVRATPRHAPTGPRPPAAPSWFPERSLGGGLEQWLPPLGWTR